MPFSEENAINLIAAQERSIAGVKDSYNYAKNPDVITTYPVVVHFIPSFTTELRAHHNQWANTLVFQSILLGAPRQTQGGKLAYLENSVIPFGEKWRTKFQTSSIVQDLLTQMGAVKFFLSGGNYGAGGTLLTYGSIEFIGWVFSYNVVSA